MLDAESKKNLVEAMKKYIRYTSEVATPVNGIRYYELTCDDIAVSTHCNMSFAFECKESEE